MKWVIAGLVVWAVLLLVAWFFFRAIDDPNEP